MDEITNDVVAAVMGMSPTKEMYSLFHSRTILHIKRTIRNLARIGEAFGASPNVIKERAENHDKTKYQSAEMIPYVWLTWFHQQNKEGKDFKYPDGVEKQVEKATLHHIEHNRHHPEFHNQPSNMTPLDIMEMVADWAAMSQELGTSLKGWVDDVAMEKWEFSKKQQKLIYQIVGLF